jgi:hypothetical protein
MLVGRPYVQTPTCDGEKHWARRYRPQPCSHVRIGNLYSVARSQSAPKTCTEAYTACTKESTPAACEAEKKWCLQSGAFAHPKTKALTSGLQKR